MLGHLPVGDAGTSASEPVLLVPVLPAELSPSGEWSSTAREGGEPERPLTLAGTGVALIDRVLPSRPVPFLLVVGLLVVAVWGLVFALAERRDVLLASAEWRFQLLFLPAHFVALRLFVTVYGTNFLAGIRHLTAPQDRIIALMRWVLGGLGGGLALLLAAPFCIQDLLYLYTDDYRPEALGRDGALGAADFVRWGVWCLEWIINAYIWVLLLGFLALTMHTLWRYRFRQHVEVVLHEKHYQPFLLMSAQGATIVFGFGIVNALYVWYADGEVSDYIGLGITLVVLLVGFGPPWLYLRARIDQAVRAEVFRLRELVIQATRQSQTVDPGAPPSVSALAARMEQILALLRIDNLERLQRELGQTEARGIVLKLLAPAGTILWRFIRPFVGFPF